MPIIFVERQYPPHKNKEVIAAWFRALEKYPQPEGLFTILIDTAVNSDKKGLKVLSAYLPNAGKYEETSAYLTKMNAEFLDIEGYVYEFNNWATIEEAMQAIGTDMPER